MAYEDDEEGNDNINNNNNSNDNIDINNNNGDDDIDVNNNIIAKDDNNNNDIIEIGEPKQEYQYPQQHERRMFIRKPKTTITLTPESYETIKQLAFTHGLPPKKFIELMLTDYIENNESNKLLKYIHNRKDKLKLIIDTKNKDISNEIGFLLSERETSDPVTLAQHILDLSSTINRITDYKAEKYMLDLIELANVLQYHQHLAVVEKALYLDNRDKKLDALEAKINNRLDTFATNTASAIARAVEPLYQNNSGKNETIDILATKLEELRERLETRVHTQQAHGTGINYQSLVEEQIREYLTTSIEGQKLMNQLFKEWLGEKIRSTGNNNNNNNNNSLQQIFIQTMIPILTQLLTNAVMNIGTNTRTPLNTNTNINTT